GHSSLHRFNDAGTSESNTLSLHDALPIFNKTRASNCYRMNIRIMSFSNMCSNTFCEFVRICINRLGKDHSNVRSIITMTKFSRRSEEHTSELQSRENIVCRLLLEKKNT